MDRRSDRDLDYRFELRLRPGLELVETISGMIYADFSRGGAAMSTIHLGLERAVPILPTPSFL